jgi:hypothetical protein
MCPTSGVRAKVHYYTIWQRSDGVQAMLDETSDTEDLELTSSDRESDSIAEKTLHDSLPGKATQGL